LEGEERRGQMMLLVSWCLWFFGLRY